MADEKTLWSEEPAGILFLYWTIRKLKWVLILFGFLLFLYFSSYLRSYPTKPEFSVIFPTIWGIVGFYLVSVVYSFFLRKTYKYTISDKTINFDGGILNKQFKSVPYHKITDVTKSQTIVQRMLGIYELHIQTAGAPYREISFEGLKNPDTPKSYIMKKISKFSARQK